MKNREFIIKAKVWRWPGEGGWHFITLDKSLFAKIRKIHPKGFVKIKATIGKTTWDTSLFPHIKSSSYLISVKASIRKKEGIFEGDEILIKFKYML